MNILINFFKAMFIADYILAIATKLAALGILVAGLNYRERTGL